MDIVRLKVERRGAKCHLSAAVPRFTRSVYARMWPYVMSVSVVGRDKREEVCPVYKVCYTTNYSCTECITAARRERHDYLCTREKSQVAFIESIRLR